MNKNSKKFVARELLIFLAIFLGGIFIRGMVLLINNFVADEYQKTSIEFDQATEKIKSAIPVKLYAINGFDGQDIVILEKSLSKNYQEKEKLKRLAEEKRMSKADKELEDYLQRIPPPPDYSNPNAGLDNHNMQKGDDLNSWIKSMQIEQQPTEKEAADIVRRTAILLNKYFSVEPIGQPKTEQKHESNNQPIQFDNKTEKYYRGHLNDYILPDNLTNYITRFLLENDLVLFEKDKQRLSKGINKMKGNDESSDNIENCIAAFIKKYGLNKIQKDDTLNSTTNYVFPKGDTLNLDSLGKVETSKFIDVFHKVKSITATDLSLVDIDVKIIPDASYISALFKNTRGDYYLDPASLNIYFKEQLLSTIARQKLYQDISIIWELGSYNDFEWNILDTETQFKKAGIAKFFDNLYSSRDTIKLIGWLFLIIPISLFYIIRPLFWMIRWSMKTLKEN